LELERIRLENFRSYTQSEFCFEPLGSLVIGPNGSGKTNLLESIAYCGIGKSIRFHRDEDLLCFHQPYFRVCSGFKTDQGNHLKVALSYAEGKKLLKLDELPLRQLSSLFDVVKVIYLAPEDLQLVSGSPRFRRQYFDLAIAQLFPAYITVLREYLHIVEQRNAMLKRSFTVGEKRSWDTHFAQSLASVLDYRHRYLERVNKAMSASFAGVFPLVTELKIDYLPTIKTFPCDAEKLLEQITDVEQRERHWQRSLIGAHLDDYEFRLSERAMKLYASQGQRRIAVIILKLIQARLIENITGIKPVLLFDDIFAELDLKHTASIHDCVDSRYQVFIASPKDEIEHIWHGYPKLVLGRMNEA
jgi:DNA replication and repair protein RecF